jgi:hypothetical protein
MKSILFFVTCFVSTAFGQLSIDMAKEYVSTHALGYYSYLEMFEGHAGYAAPVIQTADGGALAGGTVYVGDKSEGPVIKIDKDGNEEWIKKFEPGPQAEEIEVQGVLQDKSGYYYVFILSYNYKKYGGGVERVVYLNPQGEVQWDKLIGTYTLLNSPTFSWIRLLEDGRIAFRGHIVTEKPIKGSDPSYRYWEGWMNNKGEMTQQIGDVMDYETDDSWDLKYQVEE